MRKWACLLLVFAWAARAELPDFYQKVDRVIWVVKDVDKTLEAWKPAGLIQVVDRGQTDHATTYRGQPANADVQFAIGSFADIRVIFVQPVSGTGAWTDFAKEKGEGVASLWHAVPSSSALDAEVARMQSLGVSVLERGRLGDDGVYVVFDTAKEGKYLLGISYDPAAPPVAPSSRSLSQYAFVVRDAAPVSKYWAKLGWPEMSFTDANSTERVYRGKPGAYNATLGWQRQGKVVYEWIVPTAGPSTWQDHLDKYGEGVHHLAFNVPDMDAAITEWKQKGFPDVQSGGWGTKGQKGSGRFAYVDAHRAGGIDIELLWNFR